MEAGGLRLCVFAFLCPPMASHKKFSLEDGAMSSVQKFLSEKGLDLPLEPSDIQEDWSLPFMRWVVQHTTSGMECQFQEDDPPGIRISTHRDIVCDPALYNLARVEAGRPTTHIVLGSNLARLDWVKALMQANKAIFIDRSLAGRAAMSQQLKLSRHIADIIQGGGHVWIAQAPGRTKDGIDQTHHGLLRMLALAWGGEEQGPAALKGLLRPLVIRYDVNPCDGLLIREKVTGEKTNRDDEISMRTGLEGWKGKVRIAEAPTVSTDVSGDRDGWLQLAAAVDKSILTLGVSGQWAASAASAIQTGNWTPLPDNMHHRAEQVIQQLSTHLGDMDRETLMRHLCEVYREGAPKVALTQN